MNSLSGAGQEEDARRTSQHSLDQRLPHAQTMYRNELRVNLLLGHGLTRRLKRVVMVIEHGANGVRRLDLAQALVRDWCTVI